MNSKTAIVTGATSFLGSALIENLTEKGYSVVAVVRKDSPNLYRLNKIKGIKLVELNLSELDKLHEKVDTAELFFHFGWDGSGSLGRQNHEIQAKNFDYSINALNEAAKIGCKKFIFAGSQAEYGKQDTVYGEKLECYPISEYGKQKLRFGKEGFELASELGIEFIHLRIFSVYGYNDRPNTLVDGCINCFEEGGVIELGLCTHLWNFLYVKDFANITVLLSEAELGTAKSEYDTVYNVASKDTRVLSSFVKDIYDCSQKRGEYKLGARSENAEGSPSIVPEISKLHNAISYEYRYTFKEGIKEIMENKFGKKCICCGERLSGEPLLQFDNMPASAQDIPTEGELCNERPIQLNLHQCSLCGLVQFDCAPVEYYKDVIRSGGFTTTMVELRRNQYSHLISKYGLGGKKIIEVGCGQGEFLSVLKEFNVQPYGIENKASLAELARSRGLDVINGFITDGDAPVKQYGPFDAFLSFNFLEHQPDPNAMLKSIYENLTENGVGLITVPSFEYIMEHDGYYEFIRDHIAYYTFETLEFLFNKNGFNVLEREMINRDTLSIIVKKRKHHDLSKISGSREVISAEINTLLSDCKKSGERVAIWGASHQGFTIASSLLLSGKVEYIIDSAPFKQNKFAPASHIPIVAPDRFFDAPSENVIIIAPGYSDEIASIIRNKSKIAVKIYTLKSNHLERL